MTSVVYVGRDGDGIILHLHPKTRKTLGADIHDHKFVRRLYFGFNGRPADAWIPLFLTREAVRFLGITEGPVSFWDYNDKVIGSLP